MSIRNGIVLLLALSTLTLLGCGGSNNNTVAVPPPSGGFSNSNLSGTYVFSVSGYDFDSFPYAIVGTITANGSGGNGKGGITGGAVDIVDAEATPALDLSVNSTGYYQVGVDGRGQFTIGTTPANPFGSNLTFDFVLQNSSHGLITEFDSNGTGSGTLDLQASLTQIPAGPYAFSFSGSDGGANALATVGAFSLDSNGAILTGDEDLNDGDLAYPVQVPSGTVVLGPSSTPATLLNTQLGTLTFDVYAIDATHLKFIETDDADFLSGDAFSQPTAAISGTMAFTLGGLFAGNPAAAGGFMVTDGAGNINIASSEDVNNNGVASEVPVNFSATYSAAGTGRFTLSDFSGFFGGTLYAAYPSSGGLLLLEIDDSGTMSGAAYPQTSTTLSGAEGYGLNLAGVNLSYDTEVDDIAEFTAEGTGATCDKAGDILCGIIDENYIGANPPYYAQSLVGSYGAIDALGRYGIAATSGAGSGTLNGGFDLTLYTADGTTFPFIESDGGQVATGVVVLQNASDPQAGVRSRMFISRPIVRPHAVRPNLKKKK
jgi:hypothetical protein